MLFEDDVFRGEIPVVNTDSGDKMAKNADGPAITGDEIPTIEMDYDEERIYSFAMPHNKYNKIMEIVRMKKIPVKYFAYASAEKCALQLAEYDSDFMPNDK